MLLQSHFERMRLSRNEIVRKDIEKKGRDLLAEQSLFFRVVCDVMDGSAVHR